MSFEEVFVYHICKILNRVHGQQGTVVWHQFMSQNRFSFVWKVSTKMYYCRSVHGMIGYANTFCYSNHSLISQCCRLRMRKKLAWQIVHFSESKSN